MPDFVQMCGIVNELWAINEIQNSGRRHLEFIIFVDFDEIVYFRWQLSILLRNIVCALNIKFVNLIDQIRILFLIKTYGQIQILDIIWLYQKQFSSAIT